MQDDRNPLVREALRWFVRLRDDEVTEAERLAFESWRRQSSDHQAAWDRACHVWAALAPVEKEIAQRRRRAIGRRTVIGSGLGLLLAGAVGAWSLRDGLLADFQTGTAQRRSFVLADGSGLELNSNSAVSEHFSLAERRLVLHHGEAFFTVAADRARPFVVEAGAGTVRALGTQFNIDLLDDLVTVTVAEHGVEIALPGGATERLEAGWQLGYAQRRFAAAAQPIDLASAASWRNGRLVYHNVALRRVLRDFERQSGGVIVLMDDALASRTVSASFDIDRIDAALDTIVSSLPARLVRLGGLAVIYPG
jgi:transmembrane sensor